MGGWGSGGHNKIKYSVTNVLQYISICRLSGSLKEGCSGTLTLLEGSRVGVAFKSDKINLSYSGTLADGSKKHYDYDIKITYTKTNYGMRPWFVCWRCKKRVVTLYNRLGYFTCRKCCNLNYESSQKSGNTLHEIKRRIYTVRRKLRYFKLPLTATDIPKPHRMRRTTYNGLISTLIELVYLYNMEVGKRLSRVSGWQHGVFKELDKEFPELAKRIRAGSG